ncbi:MAG: type I-D CRISPR-associated helicase Cas3' [Cyanothece sp. SIO1E1]|nr:type I-D CRISPR-associated helicase Cas3' [Cyanothece sp. SIO1E1]
MTTHSINLKSVYSCPADDVSADVILPEGWKLAWHQAETLKALRDPEIDVVFNTAMTGDGKSLAAYLEMLQGKAFAISLYPTNELARDQEKQVHRYIEDFKPTLEPRVNRLSGALLEAYAEHEGLRKGSAIANRASQSEVLITNPDIFHYLHRGAYLMGKDSPDKLWNRIDKDFELFIFDEFHVFSAPQIASVLNTMLLIRATNRRKKFLFLSATPSNQMLDRLEKAKFRYHVVEPLKADKYRFPETELEEQHLKKEHWRRVARAMTLNFVGLEPISQAIETWLQANPDVIVQQFQKYPGSKGAIILNSVAAVKRLTPFLKTLLEPQGLTVRENTGLSSQTEKLASLEADLVIGTSTIDIGVDFRINFLLFESADAGNFIQRLGRLGRHDGYEKAGAKVTFQQFTAYALVPHFLIERLFITDGAPLNANATYDRPFLHEQIDQQYRQINDFRRYYKRWGTVQSVGIARQLKHNLIRDQYADSLLKFAAACESAFGASLSQAASCISTWNREWQELSGQKTTSPITEEANSFRGSSSLQCGLYDLSEPNESDRFKTYELPGILSNLKIEMWTAKAFKAALANVSQSTGTPIPKGRFKHCLAFMKLKGYWEERLNWRFIYSGNLKPIADSWKVQVLRGVQIWQPDNRWVDGINQRLKHQAIVCYVLNHPVAEVRGRLRLPIHFQLYPISDQYSFHDSVTPYSIAFGQSGLLIDTLAYTFKSKGEEIWVC